MKRGYEPGLDGLRAFAIFAVMGFHLAKPLVSGGSLGVDVFFVLSGYLITSILANEAEATARIDYRGFLLRRARRLLPALAVLLATYVLLCPLLFPELAGRRWLDVATTSFYVTNLRETFAPASTPLSHTWSLAIEEQFYILWPLVLMGLLRLSRQTAAISLVAAWCMLSLARVACVQLAPGPAAYYFTPFHATGLLLGSALALRPIGVRLGSAALALLFALVVFGRTSVSFMATIPAAEILTALVVANPPRPFTAAPMRAVGRISYGVYLWHVPIAWAVGFPMTLGRACAVAALSLLAGGLSYIGVERWFLKRRGGQTGATVAAA